MKLGKRNLTHHHHTFYRTIAIILWSDTEHDVDGTVTLQEGVKYRIRHQKIAATRAFVGRMHMHTHIHHRMASLTMTLSDILCSLHVVILSIPLPRKFSNQDMTSTKVTAGDAYILCVISYTYIYPRHGYSLYTSSAEATLRTQCAT